MYTGDKMSEDRGIGSMAGLTLMEVKCLEAIHLHGSQRAASRSLGIGVAAFHRHLKAAEERTGLKLTRAHANSTGLTWVGKTLVGMMDPSPLFTENLEADVSEHHDGMEVVRIGVTNVSRDRAFHALSGMKSSSALVNVIVADDHLNLQMLTKGLLDGVVLDDPSVLTRAVGTVFDELSANASVVFTDELVYIDRGREHMLSGLGPERMGYRYLQMNNIKYSIAGKAFDMDTLFGSGKSFFINRTLFESVVSRGAPFSDALKDVDEIPAGMLAHTVTAAFYPARCLLMHIELRLSPEMYVDMASIRSTHQFLFDALIERMRALGQ